jgi:hypothetical protein
MENAYGALLLATFIIPFAWIVLAQDAMAELTAEQLHRFLKEVDKPTHLYRNRLGDSYSFARYLLTRDAWNHPVPASRRRFRLLRGLLVLFIALVALQAVTFLFAVSA